MKLAPATRLALVAAAGLGLALAAKCVLDLSARRDAFPGWFVPLFAAGVGVLALLVASAAVELASEREPPPLDRRRSRLVWLGLLAGVPCTASLHGFLPFHPDLLEAWSVASGVMRFNFALALAALGAVAAGAALDLSGRRPRALAVLAGAAFALLAPNDDCPNAFNAWWIEHAGASPLMFLPNVFAFVCAAAALRGASPARHVATIWTIGVATLALGLGHRSEVLW